MLDVLGAVLLLIAELFIMTVTGLLFQAGRSGEDLSLCDAACDGFVFVFALFEILCIILMQLNVGLSFFCVAFGGALAFFFAAGLAFSFGKWRAYFGREREHASAWDAVMTFCILLQCAAAALQTPASSVPALSALTDYVTDSIAVCDPFTGLAYLERTARVFLNRYPTFHAFAAKLSGVSPAAASDTVFPALCALMSCLIFYRAARLILKGGKRRAAICLILLTAVRFGFLLPRTDAWFLFRNGADGRSVLANVLLPAMVLLFARMFDNASDKGAPAVAFLAGIAGLCFTIDAAFVYLFSLSAGMLSVAAVRRRWKLLFPYALSLILPASAVIFFFMAERGVISLPL